MGPNTAEEKEFQPVSKKLSPRQQVFNLLGKKDLEQKREQKLEQHMSNVISFDALMQG